MKTGELVSNPFKTWRYWQYQTVRMQIVCTPGWRRKFGRILELGAGLEKRMKEVRRGSMPDDELLSNMRELGEFLESMHPVFWDEHQACMPSVPFYPDDWGVLDDQWQEWLDYVESLQQSDHVARTPIDGDGNDF